MDRKHFIHILSSGALSTATLSAFSSTQKFSDPYPAKFVKEFVGAGHKDLERVKEMLEEYPNLLNGTWDWGNGDYETAAEGAAHMGNTEIAEYLISKGARINLFMLTMLGKVTLVKAWLEAFPDLLFSLGPHGFTLLHHAKVGNDDAQTLIPFFEERGLTQTKK